MGGPALATGASGCSAAAGRGNYQHKNPKTGEQVTIGELIEFATNELQVDYFFWCTQEPFYSERLTPTLRRGK